jgi:hypothetical protein
MWGESSIPYLYVSGYVDIDVEVSAHHLIFGELRKEDSFNWLKSGNRPPQIGYTFPRTKGEDDEFLEEFHHASSVTPDVSHTPPSSP